MNRAAAIALLCDLADADFSCQLVVAVHPTMSPRENCSVHVHAVRYQAVHLERLIQIGAEHGVELHLIGGDLRFVPVVTRRG